ncbi:MAG: FecR family protein [Burkholderiaceae bacterium]|nr:FecR family protein [Burkholderiaceae bacterium]
MEALRFGLRLPQTRIMGNPALTNRRPCALARIGFGLAMLVLACGALASELAGEVVSASGPTMHLRPQHLNSPVRSGSPIHAGDRFRTGPQARLELRMRDGAVLSIGPDSEFQVDEYRLEAGKQRAFYSLARGLVRTVSGAIGKIRHEEFRLTTPTAVMGIRGTDFSVEHSLCMPSAGCDDGALPGERLRVSVHQGRVAVSSAHGTIEVPEGQTLRLAGRNGVPMRDGDGARKLPPVQHTPKRPAATDHDYQPVLPGELGRRG